MIKFDGMKNRFILLLFISFFGCKKKHEFIKPSISTITESVYASGIVKSKDQYQAFAVVSGIIDSIYVTEGDKVKKGDPILYISSEAQELNRKNAELSAMFSDFSANEGKLNDAKLFVELTRSKMMNDSMLFSRQKNLWNQQIGTKVELEQRELNFQNSKMSYSSAIVKYDELKRQLVLTSSQSKNNYLISSKQEKDFTLKSEIDGVVYDLLKLKGELVSPQTPLAIIGDLDHFVLEMLVDEFDIFKLKVGQELLVTMDSYKGQVFNARLTKILPIMNEKSKTFTVEAEFISIPFKLFPNISFEANIVINTKKNALLIPREYLIHDSIVVLAKGDSLVIKTGLKDYKKVEVLSGIDLNTEILKPD
jgi:multidrug efflux pump subunit AcrA (membrane-fusion protein)